MALPNYRGKGGHWYAGPVVPSSCTQQPLLMTTVVPEAAAGGMALGRNGVWKEVEEELHSAQAKLGPFAAWVPEVQVPNLKLAGSGFQDLYWEGKWSAGKPHLKGPRGRHLQPR